MRYKARLVAKGFVEKYGVDFDEVFAPVARLETVRVLIAIAAQESWEIHHMDVKSAFLNGELKEEVYVELPEGFAVEGREGNVLRLRKALYGLRQAPRAWNAKLDNFLKSLGFQKCPLEHAVYTRWKENKIQIVGVYVDDLIIVGSSKDDILSFKQQMKKLFEMSDLGLLSYYLGIEVKQDVDGIRLSQSSYAAKLLAKLGMMDCNPCHVPMEPKTKLSKVSNCTSVDSTLYKSIIGSLRYLVNTRPDLSYSVGVMSRYMEAPTMVHMEAVKQILRYVKGTIDIGCHYVKAKQVENRLIGYSDSDLAGDISDRKSSTGTLFFLYGNPITWTSKKQKMVALSSCEAEYIAATSAACQGIWLGRLLKELHGKEVNPVRLNIDNKSAIALAKNPVHHDRSKHIDMRFHFIRECVQKGD